MTKLADLIARWDTDEGKPYKGSLIDWNAYQSDADNIGCMCAQGQVLHLVGGWTPDRLHNVEQADADKETAKLLNISRTHAVLLRTINDETDGAPAIILTDPGRVIGGQWSKLLDFWWHIDGMTNDQWDEEWDAKEAKDEAWNASFVAGGAKARAAAGYAAWNAACDAARALAMAAAWPSYEIQGAAILKKKGRPLFFLPKFGFSSPDDIPPRPANYGVQA